MKVVSVRKRAKYGDVVYERAGVYKWLVKNFVELNKL